MSKRKADGPVGIRQMAAELGVSIGTVDRALHGRAGVSEATRERVLELARRWKYTPNLAARNLKLNRRVRIGVFLPEEIASFYGPLREGIRAAAENDAGSAVEVEFFGYPRLGAGDVERMEAENWRRFDGVIVAPGDPARLTAMLNAESDARPAVVCVTTDAPGAPRLASIAVESRASGAIAAELLGRLVTASLPVATITGDLRIEDHAEKLRGFSAALKRYAPHLRELKAIESHESSQDAFEAALELLDAQPELGGIYISTANSLPVMRALKETGRLGRVAVIATDLFPELAALIEEGHVFASLYQRPFTQGRMAYETLSRHLVAGVTPRQVVRLAPHVVLRSNLALFTGETGRDEPLA
ncbi:MAG: LacI family DNA-binding transcriptional regulator [Terracidiphilus sp.]